jgi:hypothetical protein
MLRVPRSTCVDIGLKIRSLFRSSRPKRRPIPSGKVRTEPSSNEFHSIRPSISSVGSHAKRQSAANPPSFTDADLDKRPQIYNINGLFMAHSPASIPAFSNFSSRNAENVLPSHSKAANNPPHSFRPPDSPFAQNTKKFPAHLLHKLPKWPFFPSAKQKSDLSDQFAMPEILSLYTGTPQILSPSRMSVHSAR